MDITSTLPNPSDCESQSPRRTQTAFEDTQINITSLGKPHLGAPLGSQENIESFVKSKVQTWSEELHKLATIASNHPHAARAAFIHGMVSKWTYLARKQISVPLYNFILDRNAEYTQEANSEQYLAKLEAKKRKRHLISTLNSLRNLYEKVTS